MKKLFPEGSLGRKSKKRYQDPIRPDSEGYYGTHEIVAQGNVIQSYPNNTSTMTKADYAVQAKNRSCQTKPTEETKQTQQKKTGVKMLSRLNHLSGYRDKDKRSDTSAKGRQINKGLEFSKMISH